VAAVLIKVAQLVQVELAAAVMQVLQAQVTIVPVLPQLQILVVVVAVPVLALHLSLQ
jgi:hypothetical protein